MKFGITLSLARAPHSYIEAALKSKIIDFVEIPIEGFLYRADKPNQAMLQRIINSKEVAAHGYSLSLLDPEPWPSDRLDGHKAFFRRHNFLSWSDHYAISSWMGRRFNSLTPAPQGPDAVRLLKFRLKTIEEAAPNLPFYLENPAIPFVVGENTGSTLTVFAEVLQNTNSKILLDVSNLVANELNFNLNAEHELEIISDIAIGEIHLAGGHWNDGFFRDSHSDKVSDRSWDLFKKVVPRLCSTTQVVIEREQNYPDFYELEQEVLNAKRICGI